MPAYVECSFLITIPIQVNTKLAPPPAVLITGGDGRSGYSAELFLPSSGTSCTLPDLPELRYYHSSDNNILCGGYKSSNCLQWSPDTGTWEELLTLDLGRLYHVSWTPGNGIGTYLMGGSGQEITSTLLKPDGSQELSFIPKYPTL